MTQRTQALDMARKPYVEVSGTWRNCPEDTFEGYKVSIGWNTEDTVWDDDYFFSCSECTSRAEAVKELMNVQQDFCIIKAEDISEVMYELDEGEAEPECEDEDEDEDFEKWGFDIGTVRCDPRTGAVEFKPADPTA